MYSTLVNDDDDMDVELQKKRRKEEKKRRQLEVLKDKEKLDVNQKGKLDEYNKKNEEKNMQMKK